MPTTKQQCTEVRCLLDANAWPDAILGRAGGAETVRLLDGAEGQLATNDFTLHAIVLYLETIRSFPRLLEDLIKRKVNTLHLPASSLFTALDVMRLHGLDFDDAFQQVAAERDNLKIVSSDADFDRTPRGRLTPAQALAELELSANP